MQLKKKGVSFKSLMSSVLNRQDRGGEEGGPAPLTSIFTKTDPAVDGDECLHDCEDCGVRYPRGFEIEEEDELYGGVKGWSTHVVVATGKTDWVRDSADERGSVMEALGGVEGPTNGKLKVSASNMPTPNDTVDYSEATTVLLLPAFVLVRHVQPSNVRQLVQMISLTPTTTSPLERVVLPPPPPSPPTTHTETALPVEPCPHRAVVLLCSQRTRDARCGQSAPLLRRELERHLRPLGLARDLHDAREGGVAIYFIDHVGGHKYAANVMIYRRQNAFGLDEETGDEMRGEEKGDGGEKVDTGAAQCMWLARVRPEDCENIVRYTILRGKLVKPERQLRGGFDRCKGMKSW